MRYTLNVDKIKQKMTEQNLSRDDLVTLGIPRSSVYKILASYTQQVQRKNVDRLCEILDCTPADIAIVPREEKAYTNRPEDYERTMRQHLSPAVLKEVSDVQHGRKPFIDYANLTTKEEQLTLDRKLLDKFKEMLLDKGTITDNLFAEFGRQAVNMALEAWKEAN